MHDRLGCRGRGGVRAGCARSLPKCFSFEMAREGSYLADEIHTWFLFVCVLVGAGRCVYVLLFSFLSSVDVCDVYGGVFVCVDVEDFFAIIRFESCGVGGNTAVCLNVHSRTARTGLMYPHGWYSAFRSFFVGVRSCLALGKEVQDGPFPVWRGSP